ncbi:MAG TPA: amidase, partial [Trueperaceae bacterium]|nr:amidase [Trueperaceae bacterium]
MSELLNASALEQARLVREGKVAVTELVDAAIGRIEHLNDVLNAVCTPTFDAARAAARQAQARLDRGEAVGPLHGVPVTVKDLISTAGVRTTYGSRVYASLIPDEDDVAVERLLGAGAILLGKTNTPEFGYQAVCDSPLFGASRNPWNPERTTGGSSGGSAAAVATGMGALSLGSDGGGSL